MKKIAVYFSMILTGMCLNMQTDAQEKTMDNPDTQLCNYKVVGELERILSELYKKNAPAVVRIISCAEEESPDKTSCSKIGTGFIVDSSGYILTTADLICDAKKMKVILDDDREYWATLVAFDTNLNVAILKVAKKGLAVVTIGSSGDMRPGLIVMSITNPYGLTGSLAVGYISGRYRSGFNPNQVESFIQTNIPLNPGDTGSPLFNCQGEVVGIMTAVLVDDIHPPHDVPQQFHPSGISFAIPIDLIKNSIPAMIKDGYVIHCWIGIEIQDLMREDFVKNGIDEAADQHGVLITQVFPNSPALKAGLQQGDIIQQVSGEPVTRIADFRRNIIKTGIDKVIEITIMRGNEKATFTVETKRMPDQLLNEK